MVKMKSNEYIKLTDVKTGEHYTCLPNQEFIPIRGVFTLWGDAHLKDENNQTICHLRVLDFKDGAKLPVCLFPTKPRAVKKVVEDDNV